MNYLTDYRFDLTVTRDVSVSAQERLAGTSPGIRSLCLWHCNLKNCDILERFQLLETLQVASWDPADFNVLSRLPRLKQLWIMHLPKVTSLEPFASMEQLESVLLSRLPSWDPSDKVVVVKSFAPLGAMKRLLDLSLDGIVPADERLDTLAGVAPLREVLIRDHHSLGAFAALAALRPNLGLKAYEPATYWPCKKCKGTGVRLIGLGGTRKRKFTCPACDPGRLAEHEAEFERLKLAAGQQTTRRARK